MSSQANHRIAQLILAAGGSKRMGLPKQLLSFNKTTLIEHAISESLKTTVVHVYVVLGANYDLIQKQIASYPVTILRNSNWELGMGSSIGFGMEYIQKEKGYDAVLISLIDQPLLDSVHFNNLIHKFSISESNIVATNLGKRVGVPAIFDEKCFNKLSELNADYGARYFIERNINIVKMIEAEERGKDIDTPEQYQNLISETRF